jgi:hypothetical protein
MSATFNNPGQLQGRTIQNALIPPEGPKAIPVNIPFSSLGAGSVLVDFTLAFQQKKVSVIQTVYINNLNGSGRVTLVSQETGQSISAAAGAQAYVPIMAGREPKFTVTNQTADDLQLAFINVPMPAVYWGQVSVGVVEGIYNAGGVTLADGDASPMQLDEFGRLLVNPYGVIAPISETNLSGTITTGGVSQLLASANSFRRGFWIQNISTGDLAINIFGAAASLTAAGSILITPGTLYEMPVGGVLSNAIEIIGATTAQAFTSLEW